MKKLKIKCHLKKRHTLNEGKNTQGWWIWWPIPKKSNPFRVNHTYWCSLVLFFSCSYLLWYVIGCLDRLTSLAWVYYSHIVCLKGLVSQKRCWCSGFNIFILMLKWQVQYFHTNVDVECSIFSYWCWCGKFSIFILILMWQVHYFHTDVDVAGSLFLYWCW